MSNQQGFFQFIETKEMITYIIRWLRENNKQSQDLAIWFFDLWDKRYGSRRRQVEASEANIEKQNPILEGTADFIITLKNLKDVGIVSHIMSLFSSLVLLQQKPNSRKDSSGLSQTQPRSKRL